MKPFVFIILIINLLSMRGTIPSGDQADTPENADNYQLKKVFEGKFYIGTAMSGRQLSGNDPAAVNLIKRHFNAITAENAMKSGPLQPREGEFNFGPSDAFVEFGETHGMHIVGHNLIWHSQAPDWFFTDEQGKDISPELLKQRMESHIKTVVGRYKGRIHGWDVVNEAILNDGSYRDSKFYQILGEEYIPLAFTFAHEADPEAALYYNDYSMANPGKRAGVVAMVQQLQKKGIKIDGIGMQGHVGMDYPSLEAFENSILAYANLGVDVMITELDLSVLPSPNNETSAEITETEAYKKALNPYTEGLPDKMSDKFTERFLDLFTLFLKHEDKITRVTTWGVTDRNSWKNNWPIRGRTDYPLLFDRDNQPKAIVHALAILAAEE